LIESAVICPKCGSPTSKFNQASQTLGQQNSYSGPHNPEARSKTAAVLLAVFLGFWSYLYTFKADAKIFWASIVAPPASVLLLFLLGGGGVRASFLIMFLFVSVIFAIVAIIRQATRPESWFAEYTNSKE